MVEGLGYYVFESLQQYELNDLILCYAYYGCVCPLHNSPNDITLLLMTSNVHDQETMIIN